MLLGVKRDGLDGAVAGYGDLFDTRFGLAQLGFAVPLQKRAALIGADSVIKLRATVFKLADELFQLNHRFFKGQLGNIRRQGGLLGFLCFCHGGTLGAPARKHKGGVDFPVRTPYSIHMIPPPTIIRSPKRKRTVALRVEADGSLVVQAPLRTSLSWIQDFIRQKAGWIARRQKAQAEKRARPAVHLCDGCLVPYLGADHRIVLHPSVEENVPEPLIALDLPDDMTPECLHEEIKTELTLWYKRQARCVFAERMAHWAARLGVTPVRLVITAPRRRWGSCSAKDEIRLNWRLIMAPPELLDYVIVHELCHIPHKNHGKRFWAKVTTVIPDVSLRRQALRKWDKTPFSLLFH